MSSLEKVYQSQMNNLRGLKAVGKIGAKEYFRVAKSIQNVYNTSKKLVKQTEKLNKQTSNLKFNSVKKGVTIGFRGVETAAGYCKKKILNFVENLGHRTMKVTGTGVKYVLPPLIDARAHAMKTACNLLPNGRSRSPEIQPARNRGYSKSNRNIAGQIANFPAGTMRSCSRREHKRLGA